MMFCLCLLPVLFLLSYVINFNIQNYCQLLITWGRSNPIFAHGKMGKKVYGKKGKSIHFPLFPYTFFPMGKKWENTFFHGQKWGWTPPHNLYQLSSYTICSTGIVRHDIKKDRAVIYII